MSILSSIFGKIFSSAHAGTPSPTAVPTPIPAPSATPAAVPAPASPPVAAAAQQAPMGDVDVTKLLDGLNTESSQKLDWRRSIVDLVKLLGLDSSLDARKQLAQELHYSGDTQDSASMNVWLHREVMSKLAANGGKVPDQLK